MDFQHILSVLTICTLTYAQFVHIDSSEFESLEFPDAQILPINEPQFTDYPDIQAISDGIKSFQKKLEEEHNYLPNMQAYLTASSNSPSGQEFQFTAFLTSVLYTQLTSDGANNITTSSIINALTNFTTTNNTRIVNCTNIVPLNKTEITVEVVNSIRLGYVLKSDPEVTSRRMSGVCSLVLFYARSCQFSTLAAPHFNILPRVFPQIKMVAFNAISEQRYNTLYGITGVPSLVLFHNGKPIAKYNGSDYSLYEFTKFVIRHTDLTPNEKVDIAATYFVKPVPGFRSRDYDCSLWLAWFIVIFWTLYYVRTMHFWRKFIEDVKNIWREAEAQHEHTD